jgi:hypothetical protein
MEQEWEMHLSTLTAEDRKDPFRVIRRYCSNDTPFKMRADYYDLFLAAMYSNHLEADEPEEKGDKMWLLHLTFELLEAAHWIDHLLGKKRLIYSITEAA